MGPEASNKTLYANLRKKYLTVFLLATFADWLQGPYVYRLYRSYGYVEYDILLLYVVGFASSTIFGVLVGHLADKFGRKILCVSYSLLYSFSCLSKASGNYRMLLIGRVFGGISTSILFSTFESWYVSQHLTKYHLNEEWINKTLSASTFYNGLLAIVAGCVASLFADELNLGPLAPFLLAVPVLGTSGYLCAVLWDENHPPVKETEASGLSGGPGLIFRRSNRILFHLGVVQSLFESVMYVFVFLWTPVLSPMHPSHGFVFSLFMLCFMLGSSLYSVLHQRFRIPCGKLLNTSILLSSCSIAACSLGSYLQLDETWEQMGTRLCFVAFLCYEVAIGMYFPAIGYLRGIVVPESNRASIANWFRLPMNLLTCLVLLYVRLQVPHNYQIFSISLIGLVFAGFSSCRFFKLYSTDPRFKPVIHRYDAFVT